MWGCLFCWRNTLQLAGEGGSACGWWPWSDTIRCPCPCRVAVIPTVRCGLSEPVRTASSSGSSAALPSLADVSSPAVLFAGDVSCAFGDILHLLSLWGTTASTLVVLPPHLMASGSRPVPVSLQAYPCQFAALDVSYAMPLPKVRPSTDCAPV